MIPPNWPTGKPSWKRKRPLVKIRWDRLGLQEPACAAPTPSMADIRREITSLASRGLEPGTASRSPATDANGGSGAKGKQPLRKRHCREID